MTNEQKNDLDLELNALCARFRIKMMGVVYFSMSGTGAVNGVAVAAKHTGSVAQQNDPDKVNGLQVFRLAQDLSILQDDHL